MRWRGILRAELQSGDLAVIPPSRAPLPVARLDLMTISVRVTNCARLPLVRAGCAAARRSGGLAASTHGRKRASSPVRLLLRVVLLRVELPIGDREQRDIKRVADNEEPRRRFSRVCDPIQSIVKHSVVLPMSCPRVKGLLHKTVDTIVPSCSDLFDFEICAATPVRSGFARRENLNCTQIFYDDTTNA